MSGKYIIEASWEKIIEDDYDTALEFLLKARTDVNEHFPNAQDVNAKIATYYNDN